MRSGLVKCRVCGNSAGNKAYEIREMMFGKNESFDYFLCSDCGCLQIAERPQDMTLYYSGIYYSHQAPHGIRGYLESARDRFSLTGRGLIGRVLSTLFPNQAMHSLRSLGLTPATRILDVGCGAGGLLHGLRACGMRNLVGLDPYGEPSTASGVKILKQSIIDSDGVFDLVMFHHSFEHLWDPEEALAAAFRLLDKHGLCLVRIPVVPSYAWEHYGVNWVQIDAPRHFYIHSPESIRRLAESSGFELTRITYDSTAFQFWGSEQYVKGISLLEDHSFFVHPVKAPFSIRQIVGYARQARALNGEGRGDQAAFYLTKATGKVVE